jgi:anthranilate synthase/indole-3-glycerol phosphate synthase/phosphoribosylanthranilate isomerase
LDSGAGGSGQLLEEAGVQKVLDSDEGLRVILAGGLNPDNVVDIVEKLGEAGSKVVGLDVSSGVETNGAQDLEKIRAFVKAAKSVRA